jgi:hypothetical protein
MAGSARAVFFLLPDSLMSTEHAKLFTAASAATLKFSGIKLLEINANADVTIASPYYATALAL